VLLHSRDFARRDCKFKLREKGKRMVGTLGILRLNGKRRKDGKGKGGYKESEEEVMFKLTKF